MVIVEESMDGVSRAALARFLARACRHVDLRGRVTVLITSSREMRALNKRFRGFNKPTDVLSFPAPDEENRCAGDIAVSVEIAKANAAQLGHSVAEELKILILHGVLHLAGYDHESDQGRMARRESALRAELRLPETLLARAEWPANRTQASRRSFSVASTRKRRAHLLPGKKTGNTRQDALASVPKKRTTTASSKRTLPAGASIRGQR